MVHPKMGKSGARASYGAWQSGGRLGASASVAALAGGLGAPAPSHAREWEGRGDVGLFVALHFGSAGFELGVGVEGHGVLIDTGGSECSDYANTYSGGVARVELVDWRQVRLTLGPVVGRKTGVTGYAAEATVGMALGADAGMVAGLGIEGTVYPLNGRLAFAMAPHRPVDVQAGVGIRVPPLTMGGFCVVGRPLRRGRDLAPYAGAAVVARPLPASDRAHAARVWLERARMEWASVPSFCELAEQLAICGAPRELIARAHAAAGDEVRHAAASLQVAARLGQMAAVCLDPPAADRRHAAPGADGLWRLGVESWMDGCVGEGAAAAVAAAEAATTRDGAIAAVSSAIASDEARHAEVGWAILEWTLAVGAPRWRDELRRACSAVPARESETPHASVRNDSGISDFGVGDARGAQAIRADHLGRAGERLRARL